MAPFRAALLAPALLALASAATAQPGSWPAYATCLSGAAAGSDPGVTTFDAELGMDVPGIDDNYLYAVDGAGIPTRALKDGHTRLSVTVAAASGAASGPLNATVATGACAAGASPAYSHPGGGGGIATAVPVSSGPRSATSVSPFLASVDSVGSVRLTDAAGAAVACCDLTPNLPSLPDDWAAAIEANFVSPSENKSYTINRYEVYSRSQNAIRVVSTGHDHDVHRITDFDRNVTYTAYRNASYPNGVCESYDGVGRRGGRSLDHEHHLRPTAEFFGFSGNVSYLGVVGNVRGVPTEVWRRHISFGPPGVPGVPHYNVSYYYPKVDWRVRQETFHRRLVRVELDGERRGMRVKHSYEFMDFKPVVLTAQDFDICSYFPLGSMGGCGCTSPAPAPAPAGEPPSPPCQGAAPQEEEEEEEPEAEAGAEGGEEAEAAGEGSEGGEEEGSGKGSETFSLAQTAGIGFASGLGGLIIGGCGTAIYMKCARSSTSSALAHTQL